MCAYFSLTQKVIEAPLPQYHNNLTGGKIIGEDILSESQKGDNTPSPTSTDICCIRMAW